MSTLTVGPGQTYATIASAVAASADGDVIDVLAGTYTDDVLNIRHSLTLQSVGGPVRLVATREPGNGKGIIDEGGAGVSVTIRGFDISGVAVSDGNGAGIRYEGGTLVLDSDSIHGNQDGLLANSDPGGTITITRSEFAANGAGDGYTHNIYVNGVASLTIDGSYIHDAVVGHEVKSRAASTTITNSRIQDQAGTASYSVDLPNGGIGILRNDVIEQGPNTQNPIMVSYGEEGGAPASGSLSISGTTFINDLPVSYATGVVNATTVTASLADDQVAGLAAARIVQGPATQVATTMLAAAPGLDTTPITIGPIAIGPTAIGPTAIGPTAVGSTAIGSAPGAVLARPAQTAETTLDAPGFNTAYYLKANPDVAAAGVDPLQHFMQFGWREGRNPNAVFNTAYYEANNPDVAAAGIDPLQHFMQFGWREGRAASAGFSPTHYLTANPDVAAAGVNPLVHYLAFGQAEGRRLG